MKIALMRDANALYRDSSKHKEIERKIKDVEYQTIPPYERTVSQFSFYGN